MFNRAGCCGEGTPRHPKPIPPPAMSDMADGAVFSSRGSPKPSEAPHGRVSAPRFTGPRRLSRYRGCPFLPDEDFWPPLLPILVQPTRRRDAATPPLPPQGRAHRLRCLPSPISSLRHRATRGSRAAGGAGGVAGGVCSKRVWKALQVS